MIYQLIRRDPAWQQGLYLALALVVAVPALGHVRSDAILPLSMIVVMGSAMAAQAQERETAFLLGLPITRQQVFLARVATVMSLIWVLALVGSGMSAFVAGAPGTTPFLAVAGLAMPVALIFQSLAIREIRVPAWVAPITASIGVSLSFVAMVVFSKSVRVPVLPVLAVGGLVSAGIFYSAWNAIPHVRPGRARPQARLSGHTEIRKPWFPWWLFGWWDIAWFAILCVLAFPGTWATSLLFLWSGPSTARERLRWLDALPVSRRALFAARVLPLMAAVVCGYLLGANLGVRGEYGRVVVASTQEWPVPSHIVPCRRANVIPPLDHWVRVDSEAAVPMITAPWGETFTPPAVRIYGFLAYNPYAVGCGNSGRFFTWQDHRAGEAVEGVAAERGKRLTVRPAPRTQLVNVGAILILASFTFIPVFLNDWWRFRPLPAVLRWIIFMVFLACVLMISSVPAFHSTGPMVAMKMGNLVQAVSWTLPRDTKLAAAILFAIALPLYLAVEKLFRSTELLPTAAAAQARGNYN